MTLYGNHANTSGAATTSRTLALPSGDLAGKLLILQLGLTVNTGFTSPGTITISNASGTWTQFGSNQVVDRRHQSLWSKVGTSSEVAPTVTLQNASTWNCTIVRFDNADSILANGGAFSSTNPLTLPVVSPGVPCEVFYFATCRADAGGNTSWSSATEHYDLFSNLLSSALASEDLPSGSSSEQVSANHSSGQRICAHTVAISAAVSGVVANAQLSATAGLSALVQPSVVIDAQLGAIANLTALVQPSVVANAQLGAVASLDAQLTVGGIPGVSVDAQLGAIANLTALVQPVVVANAQLGAVASLDAQLTVGGELPLIAIANLGAIASLTALLDLAPIPSAQWTSLGLVRPMTTQWLRFPVLSQGGQSFRIKFGSLGVSQVFWRSYGVLRPVYLAPDGELVGQGIRIYPSVETQLLDLPIPPDLLAAGFSQRAFEVKKFFRYRNPYAGEPNWSVTLEDLV